MKKYVFEKAVKVAGQRYAAGDEVPAAAIPAGHLESLLRQGHVSEHEEADAAARFAAAMSAGIPAPTDEDMKAAVAEIDRLRNRVATMAVDNKKLRDENAMLTAEVEKLEAAAKAGESKPTTLLLPPGIDPDAARKVIDATNESSVDTKPAEAKAEPPKVGPAKPPELKAGGKK